MPASVALRVIDEKLYAAGYAYAADPLPVLYQDLASGLIRKVKVWRSSDTSIDSASRP